jgi:hypothetical protein
LYAGTRSESSIWSGSGCTGAAMRGGQCSRHDSSRTCVEPVDSRRSSVHETCVQGRSRARLTRGKGGRCVVHAAVEAHPPLHHALRACVRVGDACPCRSRRLLRGERPDAAAALDTAAAAPPGGDGCRRAPIRAPRCLVGPRGTESAGLRERRPRLQLGRARPAGRPLRRPRAALAADNRLLHRLVRAHPRRLLLATRRSAPVRGVRGRGRAALWPGW